MNSKKKEGTTIILERKKADQLKLNYSFVAAWITLNVHSALDAVGLTAIVANELTENRISCNVVAGYYHDHIFVDKDAADNAINALIELSNKFKENGIE